MAGGSSGGGSPGLSPEERDLIQTQVESAFRENQRQGASDPIQARQAAISQSLSDRIIGTTVPSTVGTLQFNLADFQNEALRRRGSEEALVRLGFPIPGQIAGLGNQGTRAAALGASRDPFTSGLARQLVGEQANLTPEALSLLGLAGGAQGRSQGDLLTQLGLQAPGVTRQIGALGQESIGALRGAVAGRSSPALDNIFARSGEVGPARDVLEQQFNVARQRAIESGGAQGGALERNLGALESQRALGVAEQQFQVDEQNRLARQQAELGLLGTGIEAGLGAPGQQLAALGLGGQLVEAGGGQNLAATQLGGQLLGDVGRQRAAQEQLRQGALTAGAGVQDIATQRFLAGLGLNIGGLESQLSGLQGLGSQIGANADVFRQNVPGLAQQILGTEIAGSQAINLPVDILLARAGGGVGGGGVSSALQSLGGARESQQRAAERSAAARGSAFATGGSLVGGLIGGYYGAGNPAAIQAGAGIGGAGGSLLGSFF